MIKTIKKKLNNTKIGLLIIYLRYFIYRYFIKFRFKKYYLSDGISIEPIDNDGITFFGYYNISPQNNESDIIYLKVKNEMVRGSLCELASIMLKKKDGQITKISETKAWNWQQGCMLQWYPKGGDNIIFNDYDEQTDRYISKIIDKKGNVIKIYDMPINNVSSDGSFALTLNYDRLAKYRPDYGYFNRKNIILPSDNDDGIWFLNLLNGDIKLIITLEQLKNLNYFSTMNGAEHKVNHIDINSSGTRFMFLHRWVGSQGRFMRLVTANPDGSDLFILNGDVIASHSCWLNDIDILSFCEVNGERGYFTFRDKIDKSVLFSEKLPKVDGHPSISHDGKFILTDTYPEKSRFSSLFLYNTQNDNIDKLGVFYQPIEYNKEKRIDLHPKWGNSSSSIFFESGHKGKRKFYNISLNMKSI